MAVFAAVLGSLQFGFNTGVINAPEGVSHVIFYRLQGEFEDTKGVIRIPISKKNRQHNDQTKRYKGTYNNLQNIHIKLKIE